MRLCQSPMLPYHSSEPVRPRKPLRTTPLSGNAGSTHGNSPHGVAILLTSPTLQLPTNSATRTVWAAKTDQVNAHGRGAHFQHNQHKTVVIRSLVLQFPNGLSREDVMLHARHQGLHGTTNCRQTIGGLQLVHACRDQSSWQTQTP